MLIHQEMEKSLNSYVETLISLRDETKDKDLAMKLCEMANILNSAATKTVFSTNMEIPVHLSIADREIYLIHQRIVCEENDFAVISDSKCNEIAKIPFYFSQNKYPSLDTFLSDLGIVDYKIFSGYRDLLLHILNQEFDGDGETRYNTEGLENPYRSEDIFGWIVNTIGIKAARKYKIRILNPLSGHGYKSAFILTENE